MNSLFCFVVFTSNILGSFNDPFEFDGNYGDEINSIREYVFDQVVSKEALANNLTNEQIIALAAQNLPFETIQEYRQQLVAKAIQEDLNHGPTLVELIPDTLIATLLEKQQKLQEEGFSQEDFANILHFLESYKGQKIFSFFRHLPSEFLALDKSLKDKAAREGRNLDLPILSSTEPLKGSNALELKHHLLEALFTKEILESVKSQDKWKEALDSLAPFFLKQFLGQDGNHQNLADLATPAGQVFIYWLYQALNLHLISQNETMIAQINQVKQVFAKTLGNPTARALTFRTHLINGDASVLFTQESDATVTQTLTEEGRFHPIEMQNPADGTFVFLRKDHWEPSYEVLPIEGYEGYKRGRLNVILATKRGTREKFLLASSHGNSTRAEDGRLQIAKIVEKFHQLKKLPENKDLQLIIGIDANTKTENDVGLLREHLQVLGLMATDVGPTTIKKRMVTVQHAKAGRFAVDEEDYIIVLKPENGGLYQMIDPTVGFKEEKPDPLIPLPNTENPSDHYPVGVTLLPSD